MPARYEYTTRRTPTAWLAEFLNQQHTEAGWRPIAVVGDESPLFVLVVLEREAMAERWELP